MVIILNNYTVKAVTSTSIRNMAKKLTYHVLRLNND